MTPEELEIKFGQRDGPKMEFKIEYPPDGLGSGRHMDEVAKDVLLPANSFGTDPPFRILGAADEIDATTGNRPTKSVRTQVYSRARFLDIVNYRCTPPLVDASYNEIDDKGSVYGVLKIPSSKYSLIIARSPWQLPMQDVQKNSMLVRLGDPVGVATPLEIGYRAKVAAIPQTGPSSTNKQNNPLKGVSAALIRTPLDFKTTIGADAARHLLLFKTSREHEREIRIVTSTVFSDLQFIEHDEPDMVMTFLDSIEEPLERLISLGAELFCIIIPGPYRSGDKTFSMSAVNYLFVPQDFFIARADLDEPFVHKFADNCREALLELVVHIRSDRLIEMFGVLLKERSKKGFQWD